MNISIDNALAAEPRLKDRDIAVALLLAAGWSPTDPASGAENWRRMLRTLTNKVRERRRVQS
jgi:hypothetical protein